ncbi:uncharacterized protein TNCV_415401 [Trichonephila clavipes]|nr:uncharacterized protein TNCV_415401 [Trichonephila clavipes]
MLLVRRKYNSFNNVPLVHFLIDFNASSKKTKGVLPLAQILPQTITDFGYWRCSTMPRCLLNRKELLISEKKSLSALTCVPTQKFWTSSKPYELVFFNAKLALFATCKASVPAPFLLFASPICHLFPCHERSVSWKLSDFSGLTFRWPYDSLKSLQCVFAYILDVDHHFQAF